MTNSLPGFAVIIAGRLCLPAFGSKEAAAAHAQSIVHRMLLEDGCIVEPVKIVDVIVTPA